MSATLSIIQINRNHMYAFTGNVNELSQALTSIALRDDTIAEAITRAAVEVDLKRQVGQQLIEMTQR